MRSASVVGCGGPGGAHADKSLEELEGEPVEAVDEETRVATLSLQGEGALVRAGDEVVL